MNEEQIKSLIKQLKAQDLSEDEIMNVFYETFKEGKMDRKDLETLAEAMGYELTDGFKEDSTPDPIEGGEAKAEGEISKEGEITKEEAEDLKEIKPGESPEEFKEKVEEAKSEDEISEGEDSEEKVEEKSEEEEKPAESKKDEEWEEAQKVFKI